MLHIPPFLLTCLTRCNYFRGYFDALWPIGYVIPKKEPTVDPVILVCSLGLVSDIKSKIQSDYSLFGFGRQLLSSMILTSATNSDWARQMGSSQSA